MSLTSVNSLTEEHRPRRCGKNPNCITSQSRIPVVRHPIVDRVREIRTRTQYRDDGQRQPGNVHATTETREIRMHESNSSGEGSKHSIVLSAIAATSHRCSGTLTFSRSTKVMFEGLPTGA
ncbi:hypothetical protein Poly59_16600 [Rubripirellula reticaptiva]|uniref:Uncharacterized protein n=1 Tax=Rubripirellula reticaptiva TaxID=2528013 RepID=A0A5C6F2D3_9BACT|nr:hypothetical protein Poly59_16600 [Rubripirellula reticaptiva]